MKEKVNELIIMVLKNGNKFQQNMIIEESSKLRDDLCLDSYNLAELTVHIEEEFGIDIFEDGLVSSVGEIYAKLK